LLVDLIPNFPDAEIAFMNKKPVILTFNKYYLPGYRAGGPIRTLSNMVDRLGNELDFRIVTLDRDAGSNQSYSNILHGKWNTVGHAQVLYSSPQSVSITRLIRLFNEVSPDVVYLNSFFDNSFTQRILWARRLGLLGKVSVVLAPRGEFSRGALGLKWVKKKIYLHFAKATRLYFNLIWHASSKHEQEDLLHALDFVCSKHVRVAMNLAPLEERQLIEYKVRSKGEPLRVCFLSRISPMKNLDFALKALAQVRLPIVFTIYGPKEVASYWAECESLIASCPPNITVIYEGEIHPHAVKQTLAQHDLFFFPTRGENYGHVIHEALAAGLPVLISDQTPWNNVETEGVGWAFSLNSLRPFSEKIEAIARWSKEEHKMIKNRTIVYAANKTTDPDVLMKNRILFMDAITGVN
jgi:glycosyltransferase involved in cell wall biosynthesis